MVMPNSQRLISSSHIFSVTNESLFRIFIPKNPSNNALKKGEKCNNPNKSNVNNNSIISLFTFFPDIRFCFIFLVLRIETNIMKKKRKTHANPFKTRFNVLSSSLILNV